MSEHQEQVTLFNWTRLNEQIMPELRLLFAVPNGGLRHKRIAIKLKREGVKPGVPDICLPVPRKRFHGLYIELKYGRNKPTENQIEWLDALNEQGYLAVVCYGFEEARDTILEYLGEWKE